MFIRNRLNMKRSRYCLDIAAGQLIADGARIPLTPTLFSMLRHFAQNPGRLITKQELLDEIWPNTHVTDGLVKDYVRKIRRVLLDDAEHPRFIETARGMGYRLIGDIAVSADGSAPVRAPSVAVLPFSDASDGTDQVYFATGIAEDIIAGLARFRSLVVIARDSSFLHGADPETMGHVARELNAEYLIQGSVRRAGDRIRIHVQLIEAGDGVCIWAEQYDREMADLFAIEDDVVNVVVLTLVGQLEEFGRQRAARKRPDSLAVYEYLLIGNWHLRQGGEADVAMARQLYQKAIDLEPTNARAHAEMAFSYLIEFWSDWSSQPQEAMATAFGLARMAVRLDGLDSRAHLYLAAAHHYGKANFEAAEQEYDRAILLNPNDYDAFCLRSWLLALSGRPNQGIDCAERAVRLSPLTTEDCRVAQCFAAYGARQYEEALAALRSIAEPTNHVHACRAMCLAQLGREAEAQRAMKDFLAGASQKNSVHPDGKQDGWRHYWTVRYPFKNSADLEHVLEGLSKAGLPIIPPVSPG